MSGPIVRPSSRPAPRGADRPISADNDFATTIMLNWFNAKEAQAFGTQLANFYMQRVPFESPFSEKKFATKTQDTLKKMQLQVQQFRERQQLNMFQKAKLGNAFKWALRDGGYDTQYVDEITEWLIVQF